LNCQRSPRRRATTLISTGKCERSRRSQQLMRFPARATRRRPGSWPGAHGNVAVGRTGHQLSQVAALGLRHRPAEDGGGRVQNVTVPCSSMPIGVTRSRAPPHVGPGRSQLQLSVGLRLARATRPFWTMSAGRQACPRSEHAARRGRPTGWRPRRAPRVQGTNPPPPSGGGQRPGPDPWRAAATASVNTGSGVPSRGWRMSLRSNAATQ
jgi:hypothetical protein